MAIEYTWNGCTYTVRRETVKDALAIRGLALRFPPETPWDFAYTFARWVTLTTTDKGDFVLGRPPAALTPAELVAAADAWGDDDPDAMYLFTDAAARAKEAYNAAHLAPGADAGNSPAPNVPND